MESLVTAYHRQWSQLDDMPIKCFDFAITYHLKYTTSSGSKRRSYKVFIGGAATMWWWLPFTFGGNTVSNARFPCDCGYIWFTRRGLLSLNFQLHMLHLHLYLDVPAIKWRYIWGSISVSLDSGHRGAMVLLGPKWRRWWNRQTLFIYALYSWVGNMSSSLQRATALRQRVKMSK